MKVTAYGEEYECAKAERGADTVRLYDANGRCTASFAGIPELSAFEITGGEWSDPAQTPEERIGALEAIIDAQAAALAELGVTV